MQSPESTSYISPCLNSKMILCTILLVRHWWSHMWLLVPCHWFWLFNQSVGLCDKMPLWSTEEWKARIGFSWCAVGRPFKSSDNKYFIHGGKGSKIQLVMSMWTIFLLFVMLQWRASIKCVKTFSTSCLKVLVYNKSRSLFNQGIDILAVIRLCQFNDLFNIPNGYCFGSKQIAH